jgi:hypothetical protein
MDRRAFLLTSGVALACGASLLTVGRPAQATTARLVTLEELLSYAAFVVVGRVAEHRCVWEDMTGGRRIVTYTRVAIERAVVGEPGAELWVRTLGGVVDRIGQAVAGDAQLREGTRAMLFLARASGAVVVAAMAQGHFPITLDDAGAERLGASPDAGLLVGRPGPTISARERLVGATPEVAVAAIRAARSAP